LKEKDLMMAAGRYSNVSKLLLPIESVKQLSRPVHPSELFINEKGWLYLSQRGYLDRLNAAVPTFVFKPVGSLKRNAKVAYQEWALYINGSFVSEAFGESSVSDEDIEAENIKYTALVRVCKDLGIASELWDPRQVNKLRSLHFDRNWCSKKRIFIWSRISS
jgi:hypothetical protein